MSRFVDIERLQVLHNQLLVPKLRSDTSNHDGKGGRRAGPKGAWWELGVGVQRYGCWGLVASRSQAAWRLAWV